MKLSINKPQSFEETLDLFEPDPSMREPHFTDDPEQTYLWSNNALPQEEMCSLSAHLCVCEYCQTEIAEMVQAGVLHLSVQTEKPLSTPPRSIFTGEAATNAKESQTNRFQLVNIAACCAVALMLCVGGYKFAGEFVAWSKKGVDSVIGSSNYGTDSDNNRTRGGKATNGGSAPNRYSTTPAPIAKNIPVTVEPPPRQYWLIPDDFTEPQLMSGTPATESETPANTSRPFQAKSESELRSDASRIAYGQDLLRHKNFAEAKKQFQTVRKTNANSLEASIGLGYVAYAEDNFVEAYKIFNDLCSRQNLSSVEQFIVEYNAARSADKEQNWDNAKAHFKRALELLQTEKLFSDSLRQPLQEEIECHLDN